MQQLIQWLLTQPRVLQTALAGCWGYRGAEYLQANTDSSTWNLRRMTGGLLFSCAVYRVCACLGKSILAPQIIVLTHHSIWRSLPWGGKHWKKKTIPSCLARCKSCALSDGRVVRPTGNSCAVIGQHGDQGEASIVMKVYIGGCLLRQGYSCCKNRLTVLWT